MAIYTTFFLCRPEELPGGFSGWRLPLARPIRRKFRNPFTGEESVVETREPEWPEEATSIEFSIYGPPSSGAVVQPPHHRRSTTAQVARPQPQRSPGTIVSVATSSARTAGIRFCQETSGIVAGDDRTLPWH